MEHDILIFFYYFSLSEILELTREVFREEILIYLVIDFLTFDSLGKLRFLVRGGSRKFSRGSAQSWWEKSFFSIYAL